MLSDTLTEGLKRYEIGPKIRALRVKKKLGLAQLGEHTGLSPALLSKIERGNLFPTLPTLLRIAMVFGVGLEHFFVETKTSRWSPLPESRIGCGCPTAPPTRPRPISSRVSILRCLIASRTFTMQSFLEEPSHQTRTSMLGLNSYTRSTGDSS